jgi:hypothetical protein
MGFDYDPAMGGVTHYVGPSELITDEPRQITQFHASFGAGLDYIGTNPIVFAAKPGTYAFARENPHFDGGPSVGPLAHSLAFWTGQATATHTDPSLKQVIDRVAGWRGIGEIDVEGAISWGDYTAIDRITTRIRPGGLKDRPDAKSAVRERISLGIGTIEDFAVVQGPREIFVLTKNWDEAPPKWRWDLWRVEPGKPLHSVREDILFPKFEAIDEGALLYDEGETPLLSWHSRDGSPAKVILEGERLHKLLPAFDRRSIHYTLEDSVHGTETDQLFETSAGPPELRDEFDLTAFGAIAGFGDDSWILASSEDDGRIFRRRGKSTQAIGKLPFAPREIVTTPDAVYFIASKNESLIRWDGADRWEIVDLLTGNDELLAPFESWKGGCEVREGTLYLASQGDILVIDENLLTWRPLEASP